MPAQHALKVVSAPARNFADRGCDIVAVADVMGGVVGRNNRPLPIPALVDHTRATGSVVDFPGSESITNEELIAVPCDVLIPAALEGVLHEGTADVVRAALVVEAANMPTTAAADEMLRRKNITVIPDILANAGGVIASYFEWSQNLQQSPWSARKVDRHLRSLLVSAYREVSKVAAARTSRCGKPPMSSLSIVQRRPRVCAATCRGASMRTELVDIARLRSNRRRFRRERSHWPSRR